MKLLAFKLKTRELKVKTTFLKRGHLFTYLLEIALVRLLVGKKKKECTIRTIVEERPNLFKRLFNLFLILDLMSIFGRFLFKVYFPKKLGYIIIVEEYIQATIADYIYLARVLRLPLKTIPPVVSFMQKLLRFGGSMQTIFLDAPNAVLKKRWSYRMSLNERPAYLQMQRCLLLSISKKLSSSFLYIDTSSSNIEETHKLIMNYLQLNNTIAFS